MIAAAAAAPVRDAAPPDRTSRPLAMVYVAGVAVASLVAMLFVVGARLELFWPAQSLMSAEVFAQLALLRDAVFALAVTLPSVTALGLLLLPGTRTLVVERLERLGIGGFGLAAAALLLAALTTGWPSLLAVAAAGATAMAGAIAQSIAFLVRLRAPRPRGGEPTTFARSLAMASLASLVAMPVSLATFVVLITEHVAHQPLWRNAGGDPLLFAHWLHVALRPVAYLAVVPCIGAVSDVLGARSRGLGVATASLLLLGGVAWGSRLFGHGDAGAVAVTSFFSLALLAPAAMVLADWLVAIRSASPRDGAFWLAVAATISFFELWVTAPPLAMADLSLSLGANAFAAAHHALLLATLGFAVAAAVHRAWPTLAAAPSQRAAIVGGALAFVGLHVAVVAEAIAGVRGMPLTIDYPATLRPAAIVAGAGWILVAAGAAVVGANLLATLRRR